MKKIFLLFVSLSIIFAAVYAYGESADEWKNKGKEYLEAEEYEKAHECFNKAIEIDPNHSMSLFYRGTLLLTASRSD